MSRALLVACSFLAACNAAFNDDDAPPGAERARRVASTSGMRDVLLVGNSVAGSVSLLDARSFQSLGTVNVVPDLQARLWAIDTNLVHLAAYQLIMSQQKIKHFEPANGQRFVDDVFVSPDGTRLYVSRSNLGDVAAFDLTTPAHSILWRTDISGYKSDHATLSPDGTRLIVSATLSDIAQVLDATTGAITGSFATGHYPHQNDYSADGKHIYNGSIGMVSLPSALDFLKGPRLVTVVDAQSLAVVRSYWFPEGVRPSVISADEKTLYAQLSYQNGLIKYDLVGGDTIASLDEPLSAFATANYPTRDDYPHDSAHHGLALSGDGTRLCDAGTIDNTVSIVDAASLSVISTIDTGLIPYWASTSPDGDYCFVTLSGANAIAVVSYASGQEVARVPVGSFPQRNRLGQVPESVLATLQP